MSNNTQVVSQAEMKKIDNKATCTINNAMEQIANAEKSCGGAMFPRVVIREIGITTTGKVNISNVARDIIDVIRASSVGFCPSREQMKEKREMEDKTGCEMPPVPVIFINHIGIYCKKGIDVNVR